MKYEFGTERPEQLKEYWPGQYELFSHYEYLSGVPHALFLITTRKENGMANACYHTWSAFSGDGGGFFVVLTGLMQHTHTYKNILREKEFCVNFLSPAYDAQCKKTIVDNGDEVDEIVSSGLTTEAARIVAMPRVKEAFLTFECLLESVSDLSGKGVSAMIVGRVVNAAVDENHKDIASWCKNFTYYIHAPKDPATGEGEDEAWAVLAPYGVPKPKDERYD